MSEDHKDDSKNEIIEKANLRPGPRKRKAKTKKQVEAVEKAKKERKPRKKKPTKPKKPRKPKLSKEEKEKGTKARDDKLTKEKAARKKQKLKPKAKIKPKPEPEPKPEKICKCGKSDKDIKFVRNKCKKCNDKQKAINKKRNRKVMRVAKKKVGRLMSNIVKNRSPAMKGKALKKQLAEKQARNKKLLDDGIDKSKDELVEELHKLIEQIKEF